MNAACTRPPTLQEIEAAAQVQRHVLQAADHATAGDYRRAHAAAEAAQGGARRLKELLGAALQTKEPKDSQ
jgi:hypothetical protein